MSFWTRLFANDYARQLTDPGAYRAPQDPEEVRRLLESRRMLPETLQLALGTIDTLQRRGVVSVAAAVDVLEHTRDALRRETDRSMREFGATALASDFSVVQAMIDAANRTTRTLGKK